MLSLILLLVLGSGMAFLALQNTILVPVTVFTHTIKSIPLFYVIIASMLAGIVLSYLIHLSQSISSSLTIRSKDQKIRSEKKELAELTKKYHQLELENARLTTEYNPKHFDDKSL